MHTKNVYLCMPTWVIQSLGGSFMKDISATLLVSAFVLFALISLLTAIRSSENASPTIYNQETVSDLGLRFAFKR